MATSDAADEPSRQLPARRRGELVAFVGERGQVTVAELAERFSVSIDTVRRDLDQLDADGLLIRTHGGAVSQSAAPRGDRRLDIRMRINTAEKERIGRAVADRIEDGTVLMINGGTTTLAVVRNMRDLREVTIATNSLRIPSEIPPSVSCELYVFGGPVRQVAQTTTSPISFGVTTRPDEIEVRADVAIVGVGAVSETGYSTSDIGDAGMMAAMMARAERVIVVADASKFGRALFAQVSGLDAADVLVTDAAPPAETAAALEEAGVEVLIAP